MLEVKNNFRFGKSDLSCSLGCDTTEDQEHILRCPVLRESSEDNLIEGLGHLQPRPLKSQRSNKDSHDEVFVKLSVRVRVKVKVKSQKSKLDPEVGVVMGWPTHPPTTTHH